MSINLQQKLVEEIQKLCKPITLAAESTEKLKHLLRVLGWDLDNIRDFPTSDLIASVDSVETLVDDLSAIIASPPQSLSDLSDVLVVIKDLSDAVNDVLTPCKPGQNL